MFYEQIKSQEKTDRSIPNRRNLLDREHERVNDELIRQFMRLENASQAAQGDSDGQ